MASGIVTLTVNPALDKSTTFTGLVPEQKIRCSAPRYDAGGGGVNVSKAIMRLGGTSRCLLTSGGSSGKKIESLLTDEGLDFHAIPVSLPTRENLIALERSSNAQYRFGFPGAPVSSAECDAIIEACDIPAAFFVASGSLNEDMPEDFYARVARKVGKRGGRFIVDASGPALIEAMREGVYLIKPNIGELAKLSGTDFLAEESVEQAARELMSKYAVGNISVSLGPRGAMLITAEACLKVNAPHVRKRSTVGAGDSMVGGMVWALAQNKPMDQVIRWGVACGSAATMNEGTQLFSRQDAVRLYESLTVTG